MKRQAEIASSHGEPEDQVYEENMLDSRFFN